MRRTHRSWFPGREPTLPLCEFKVFRCLASAIAHVTHAQGRRKPALDFRLEVPDQSSGAACARGWRQRVTTFDYSASLYSPMLLLAPSPARPPKDMGLAPPARGALLALGGWRGPGSMSYSGPDPGGNGIGVRIARRGVAFGVPCPALQPGPVD